MTHSLVQLSDPHIRPQGVAAYGRVDTAAALGRAVDAVLALRQPPSAVVLTGDCTDYGSADEYANLRRLLAPLRCPLYLLAGNHDDREQLRRAFPDHAYLAQCGEFLQYAVDIDGVRLVALDTNVPGEPHGELCEKRLAWLERTLAEQASRPTIVALHHPPFRTLIGYMDDMGLRSGARELAAIVARHPQIDRVICGHLHRSIQTRWAGTVALTAPSTAHQLQLDLSPNADPAYTLEPPGFVVHAWSDANEITSHVAYVGPHPGPYPFQD